MCNTSHLASLGTSPSGGVRKKRKVGIFRSPRVYIKRKRSEFFQVPQPIWGESLKFFQVPELIWGEAQNFLKFQGLYRGEKS